MNRDAWFCTRCKQSHTAACPRQVRTPRQESDDRRGSAASRGYDGDWERLQRVVISRDPICRLCREAWATMVDHIVPIRDGGARLDTDNLQPLCRRCHAIKTAEDLRKRNGSKRAAAPPRQ